MSGLESASLRWFSLLVGYGALIPNTWRRCAIVVGILAATPLVFLAALTLWVRPLETEVALNAITGLALWIGVAAALVVFTAYRIELLHEEAAEARRLGQYTLKELLGAGGMGEVYLAEHLLLKRPCAVKLIRPEKAGRPATLAPLRARSPRSPRALLTRTRSRSSTTAIPPTARSTT